MRKVAIVGIGQTPFGKHYEKDTRELAEEAIFKAMKDAGAKAEDIQIAFVGSVGMDPSTPMMIGQIALEQMGIKGIPITRLENACASGSNALHLAWLAIQSGMYDVALALGVEKMSTPTIEQARMAMRLGGGDALLEGSMGLFPPGIFAMIAQIYMEKYDARREDLAMVSVKNHKHASLNPLAQYQREVSLEEVLNSRPVSWPLGVLDCCPISDGAACAILASEEATRRFSGIPVWIKASVQVSGKYNDLEDLRPDTTIKAGELAYKMAGIGPEEIDFAEVHDCFSFAEIMHYEDLGFCKRGEGARMIREKKTFLGGEIPVNTSGGLLAKGHPLAATGIAQAYEAVLQLRGGAGKRQVENAKFGLTHNGGGFRHGDVGIVVVHIFGKEK